MVVAPSCQDPNLSNETITYPEHQSADPESSVDTIPYEERPVLYCSVASDALQHDSMLKQICFQDQATANSVRDQLTLTEDLIHDGVNTFWNTEAGAVLP